MRLPAVTLLPLLARLAHGTAAPTLAGMDLLWQDAFAGAAGTLPDQTTWTIALSIDTNNEVETYTSSNQNIQISGGGTVQLIPRKAPSGQWTSGRLETKASWTPAAGRQTVVQANVRMGANTGKQGIWPAFWMMGDAVRHGTQWPACGELDIMEQIDGAMTGYGTAHCQQPQGGVCNEPSGRAGTIAIPDNGWHVWALKWNRTSANWQDEVITWMLDGTVYHTLAGSDIGDQAVWSTLAHAPYYVILDVAVGGNFPGAPNAATQDGFGSMMEIEYVAVYQTA